MKKITKVLMLFVFAIAINIFAINTIKVDAYSITDGKVQLDIPGYDENTGWIPGDVKTAKITVNFEDATSTNKTIKVKLPDGMRYISYPVLSKATSGELSKIESNATGTFASLLESSTSSSGLVYSPESYTNEVTYNMKNGTEKVEIVISVTVDEYLYYGPKDFTADNGIQVSASKNATSIGDAKMAVKAINNGSITFNLTGSNLKEEHTVLQGSTTKILGGSFQAYRPGFLYPIAFRAKAYENYFYYPKNVNIKATGSGSGSVVENNSEEGYSKNTYANGSIYPILQVYLDTSQLPVGTYQNLDGSNNPVKHKSIITTYDGKEIEVTSTSSLYTSPKIIVVDEISEKLQLNVANRLYSNTTGDNLTAMTFSILNDNLSDKEGQYLEVTPGDNMEAKEVVLPNEILEVKYKTNNNSTYTTLAPSEVKKVNSPRNNFATINTKSLGLADDEYFTSVIVKLDTLPAGFGSGIASGKSITYTYESLRVLAKLKDSFNTEKVNIKLYKLDADDNVIADTLVSNDMTLTRSVTPINVGVGPNLSAVSMDAGTTYTQSGYLDMNGYYYNNAVGMSNPAIYLKIPDGVTIPKDSVKVTIPDSKASNIDFTVSDPYTVANGDKYIEIDIKHAIGGFYNGGEAYRILNFSFDIKANLLAEGNYKWSDYAFVMDKSNKTGVGTYNGVPASIVDTNDIDRDGNTTERATPFKTTNYVINQKKDLLIDTYIKESKTADRSEAYETSKPNTAVTFTPGTEAAYYVEVYNNRNDAAGTTAKMKSWIPVPKKDLDFGSDFQDKPGYWNMKLGSVQPVIKVYKVDPTTGTETDITATKAANYKLEYSTDASSASDYEGVAYSSTLKQNATMIRLTNDVGVDMQEKAVIEFVYVVDETADSVIGTDKLGKINDFRPYYYFNAGSAGYSEGTRVGANLAIGEISGLAFKDVNNNGTYQSADDAIIKDIEVSLFKMDDSGTYQPYIDPSTSTQAKAITDSEGKYKFTNLPNGKFKIDFSNVVDSGGVFTPKNIGTDYKIDSDVDQNGTNIGTALEIDPTKDTSKYIYAGLLEYNPPVDLKLSSEKTSVTILGPLDGTGTPFSETVKLSIEPTYFATIADKTYDTDGIKVVSSDDTKVTGEVAGELTNKGTTLETPLVITGVSVGTGKVTVSVKDTYGQTKTVEVNVTVSPNSRPVISASDTTVEAGDTTFNLLSLATINDAEDGTTGLTRSIKSDGGFDVNVPGTYTVVYESNADSDGNKALDKTITVTVEDTTKPELTITSKDDKTINPTEITLSATDNATGTIAYAWSIVDSSNDAVDNGTGKTITLPTADGVYTLKATASDASGNTSDEETFTFTVDNTAPTTKIDIVPTTNYNPTKVELSATDTIDSAPKMTYVLKKDGTVVDSGTDVSSPQDIVSKATADGVYTVELTAKDAAGNVSSKATATFTVDNTAPSVKIDILPTTNYNPTKVELSATDAIDSAPKMTYVLKKDGTTVDSGTDVNSPQDIVSKATADGVYTVELTAKDTAGNVSSKATATFTVDNTKPVINADASKKGKVGASKPADLKALYNLSASDNIDTSIDGTKVTVSDNINMNKVGTYKVTFEVTDAAGNKQVKEVEYIVEALIVSGVVYEDANYNSTKDDTGVLAGVTLRLLDADTNAELDSTTSDSTGKYEFKMPVGNENTTKYIVQVVEKTGYILADKGTDSIIDLSTLKSDEMSISGEDYLNKNIGMAKDVVVSVAPTTLKVYVGDTVTGSIALTNGSLDSSNINNSNASLSSVTTTGYDVTGLVPGTSKATFEFLDGYKRNSVVREVNINVVALPTASGKNIVMSKGEEKASELTFTPTDGITTYSSSATSKVTVDTVGKLKAVDKGSSIINGKVVTDDVEAKEASTNIAAIVGNNAVIGTKTTRVIDFVGIAADDISLTWTEANALTDAILKEKTEVFADAYDLTAGTITPIDIADINVDSSQIDLSLVPEDGSKVFEVTFETSGVSTTVNVTIAGKYSVVNPTTGEGISAKDFTIKVSDVAGLTDSKVISLAKAKAWNILDDSSVTITKVDYSKVKAKVGTYEVTFTTDKGTTITVEVKVVADTEKIEEDEDKEEITDTPDGGAKELTIALLLLGVSAMSGIAYGLTRRKVRV